MYFKSRKYALGVLLAATVGFAACGVVDSQSQDLEQTGSILSMPMLQTEAEVAERSAGRELARALALSLQDPAMRDMVRAAMEHSAVKENKIHFNSYIRGPGRALLEAMSTQIRESTSQLEDLAQRAGSMELYLPVEAHRSAWQGGDDLLVATLYRDHEVPAGFDLNGKPVLLSAEEPPVTPTLILVPAEAFEDDGTPLQRDLKSEPSSPSAMGDVSAQGAYYTGVWVKYVYIEDDHEGWGMGNPEFEMYLERVGSQRSRIRCADASSATPFRWDMNGKEWSTPFLIASDQETPSAEGLVMHFYEDDDTRCAIKDDKDYLKLTMDALVAANGVYQAYQTANIPMGIISFYSAATAIYSMVKGNDEAVGVVVTENMQPIDGTERRFFIKHSTDGDPNNISDEKGQVILQWTTRWQ
jgi:hypothetical protein